MCSQSSVIEDGPIQMHEWVNSLKAIGLYGETV